MSWDYYGGFQHQSVAERRKKAEEAVRKMQRNGEKIEPVQIEGRKIATTFWGKAWCDNLESYSDYDNRLPRGRSYVLNSAVVDLKISAGKVAALVQGTSLYKVNIQIEKLSEKRWEAFKEANAGKVSNLLDLLQGRLSKDILSNITERGSGLFPSPKEIKLSCSCPDRAGMCKHVAAVLYGVGARLDAKPELFFTLRGVDMQALIVAASAGATDPLAGTAEASALAGEDLSALFGVEIETTPTTPTKQAKPAAAKKTPAKKPVKKPAVQKARTAMAKKSAKKTTANAKLPKSTKRKGNS
jgi:uncharacterized Zn finger protein